VRHFIPSALWVFRSATILRRKSSQERATTFNMISQTTGHKELQASTMCGQAVPGFDVFHPESLRTLTAQNQGANFWGKPRNLE
jgi:hypothetical protein